MPLVNVSRLKELTAKIDNLMKICRTQAEHEADMYAKLVDVERQYNECSSSLNWYKEMAKELEIKLTSTGGILLFQRGCYIQ